MHNNANPYNASSPVKKDQQVPAPTPPVAKKGHTPEPSTREMQKEGETQNEGEGSRTAARRYDEATQRYVESGKVEEAAKAAEKALDGAEGDELRQAEAAARDTAPQAGTQRPLRR